jgi:hypothetical protein
MYSHVREEHAQKAEPNGVHHFPHLLNFSTFRVHITDDRKLEINSWNSDLWNNVHTNFHELLLSHSLVTECVQTDITCEVLVRSVYASILL